MPKRMKVQDINILGGVLRTLMLRQRERMNRSSGDSLEFDLRQSGKAYCTAIYIAHRLKLSVQLLIFADSSPSPVTNVVACILI
jgi:hypothetical protein